MQATPLKGGTSCLGSFLIKQPRGLIGSVYTGRLHYVAGRRANFSNVGPDMAGLLNLGSDVGLGLCHPNNPAGVD